VFVFGKKTKQNICFSIFYALIVSVEGEEQGESRKAGEQREHLESAGCAAGAWGWQARGS
jgi:hypothetical protein